MSYFETRRKEKIEEQLSEAIAEEEAISDIKTEAQQLQASDENDTTAQDSTELTDSEVPASFDNLEDSQNTEDKSS